MRFCDGDFGIKGDGEYAFKQMVDLLISGGDYLNIPGLVYKDAEGYRINKPHFTDLDDLVLGERNTVDNKSYFTQGGQGNIETKRGCDKGCIYCADPLAKGTKIRLRSPESVVDELDVIAAPDDHLPVGVVCEEVALD